LFLRSKNCGVEGAACAAPSGARRESLASDSAACACVGEPRPLRQIKRLIRKNGAFLFLRSKNCGVEGAACAAPGGARRESLASDSAACACVGEPRSLRQIKRLIIRKNGAFLFLHFAFIQSAGR